MPVWGGACAFNSSSRREKEKERKVVESVQWNIFSEVAATIHWFEGRCREFHGNRTGIMRRTYVCGLHNPWWNAPTGIMPLTRCRCTISRGRKVAALYLASRTSLYLYLRLYTYRVRETKREKAWCGREKEEIERERKKTGGRYRCMWAEVSPVGREKERQKGTQWQMVFYYSRWASRYLPVSFSLSLRGMLLWNHSPISHRGPPRSLPFCFRTQCRVTTVIGK